MHNVRVISLSCRVRTALHRHRISHAALSCGTPTCGPRRRQPLCTRSEASADTHVTHQDARCDSRKQSTATKPVGLDADGRLYSYLLQHTREPEVLQRLRAETARAVPKGARMQISPEQGQLMGLLVEAVGARRAIEVGTFTGYSSIAIAQALPQSGRLVTIDRDERAVNIAREFWQEAGVSGKIDARVGLATDVLQAMLPSEADAFDFAFIDADKRKNWDYYEMMLKLVRPGGLILIDNVLFYGRVADPKDDDKKIVAIRELNQKLLQDDRITLSIVPVGDGIAICRRR